MKLITWNVQWCRGMDGKVDPARIVKHAKAIADFDVLCLQEIANHYPAPRLEGSRGENQFAELARLLPGYAPVPGVAVDVPAEDGGRRHFGNMVLSRLPVGQVFRHLLPYPVEPGFNGMPRIALETVLASSIGPLRVITTHLEYYGTRKRTAQVEALRRIYADGSGHARLGSIVDTGGGPFHTLLRPAVQGWDPAARRRVGGGTAWGAAPGHLQDLREGAAGRSGAALRFHLRVGRSRSENPAGPGRSANAGVRPSAGVDRGDLVCSQFAGRV